MTSKILDLVMQDLFKEFSKNHSQLLVQSLALAEMDMKVMLSSLHYLIFNELFCVSLHLLVEKLDLDIH